MVEACIDRTTGEIIVVKPPLSLWSDKERDGLALPGGPPLIVVNLDDADLKLAGEVKAYPYAVCEPDPADRDGGLRMVEKSRWKVDRRELAPGKTFRRADLKESLADYPVREVLKH